MNFDFYNLLFPKEFENFCRDVLEVREKPLKFTTYRRGKDGGIDIKATNSSIKIIGQCKLYNPNNYSVLKTALKKEIAKCKRQNPDRYILCINYNLSVSEAKEILDFFSGYIVEEDIIDGIKLNKYLGLPEYKHLLKTYSKLLVPNLHFIELTLENIVNNSIYKKYHNQTKSFLNIITKEHKLYHNTKILESCINKLEKNNVLILTGNPGIGKTTTAKMIANYFFHLKIEQILFLSNIDFSELEGLIDENQLIIIDDFWGQNFSTTIKENSTLRNFNRIISDYKNGSNRYLLLTSREYIIKEVLNNSEFETKTILENEKYIIDLNNYSDDDRVRIFLNHLLYYDFEKEYFTFLKYDNILENIISHKNYSPRHIEYFIKENLKDEKPNRYSFFKKFYVYLNSPQEYWNNNFKKLNDTSQLILFIILISSDRIDIIDLEKTFDKTQEASRRILNKDIQPTRFHDELKILENFYIVSEKIEFSNQLIIQFQNPGIRDFLLEYLRKEGKSWIKPLIENAPYFNQLNFIFSTKQNNIDDFDSENPLFGKKIILSQELQTVLKHRLIKEFHQFEFCTPEIRDLPDYFRSYKKTKYWKLTILNDLFNLDDDINSDVRTFIICEVQKDIENYNSNKGKIVDTDSMLYFPSILKLIKSYIQLNKQKIISSFYSSITFTKEFDAFYEFKDIFPFQFEEFFKKNIIDIRKSIRFYIIDDIDYYLEDELYTELEDHLYFLIEEVCKKYGVRITSKFVEKIEDNAGQPFRNFPKTKKQKNRKSPKHNKFISTKFDMIIDDYLPENENNFKALQYLKKFTGNKELIKTIKKDLKNENPILNAFTENQTIFSAMLDFLSIQKLNLYSYNQYSILDAFISNYITNTEINYKKLESFFIALAKANREDEYSITNTQIKHLLKEKELSIEDYDLFFPILMQDKNWFKFSSHYFKIYFITKYLKDLIDNNLFKEEVIDYSFSIYETNLLKILNLVCKKRLIEIVIIPELKCFISKLNSTSEKSIVLSFIEYFDITFELELNKRKKRFEGISSTNTFSILELILDYLNFDFDILNFEIYFCKNSFSGHLQLQHLPKKEAYKKLYERIIETISPKTGKHTLTNEKFAYYEIDIYKFMLDKDNYNILREIGLEKYILNIIKDINIAIENIK